MPTPEEQQRTAVATGLRVGTASTICLVVTEWFHLDMGYLSVLSAHLVMAQYTYTSFQKGVERILGRLVGVLFGLALVLFCRETPALYLTLFVAAQLFFYYVYVSGRLAYAGLQAGAFSVILVATGITSPPAAAVAVGASTVCQILLGVGAAVLVNAATGAEYPAAIETGSEPLLPLRADWLSKALMLTTTTTAAMVVSLALDLPIPPTVISAAILGTAPQPQALRHKAYQRAVGPVAAAAYGLGVILILSRMPHFPLLLAFLLLGMFSAAYLTRASTHYSYAALQSGLALPMVLVSAPGELSALAPALQRLVGVGAGFLTALAVEIVWPAPRAQEG